MSRPAMTDVARSGDLDGAVDATNRNACDPSGRFARRKLPESDFAAYRKAYNAAYARTAKLLYGVRP